jgi:hypothetical protein
MNTGQFLFRFFNDDNGFPGDQLAQFSIDGASLPQGWNTIEIPELCQNNLIFNAGSFYITIFALPNLPELGVDTGSSGHSYFTNTLNQWEEYTDGHIMIRSIMTGGSSGYGDIDDNGEVEAFDASLVLSYVVGYDPIPEIDPIPWLDWRVARSDVSLNGEIEAFDGALILCYVIGTIPELPWTTRSGEIPEASLTATLEDGYLKFSAQGAFYSATLDLGIDISRSLISSLNENLIFCTKGSKLAIATSQPISGDIIQIQTIETGFNISGTVNSREGMISCYVKETITSASVTEIYPNPFNPETNIQFELAESGDVSLDIYNLKGQKVVTLIDANMEAGSHTTIWNAQNQSSGIYLLRFVTGNTCATKKIILLK